MTATELIACCRRISSRVSAGGWLAADRVASRRGLPLLICLSVAACAAPRPPAGAPAPPAEAFTLHPADAEWIARLMRAEDRRVLEPELVVGALEHRLPEIRRRAVLAAGRIGDPVAVNLLRNALADDDARVRAEAAFALGLLASTDAVSDLVAMTDGAERDAGAREAVAALGRIGSDDALRAVEDVLRRREPATLVAEALLWIWRFERRPSAAELVLPYLRSEDAGLRWRAAYALMRMGDPAATLALIDLLQADADPAIRAVAARGLDAPTADSARVRGSARSALVAALGDPHPHVRIAAMRAIAGYDERELAGRVALLLQDGDPNAGVVAAESLGAIGGAESSAALGGALDDARVHPLVRRTALIALARSDPATAAPRLERAAVSPDWLDRLYAARALAHAWPTAGAVGARLAADEDGRVAASALTALAASGEEHVEAAHVLFLGALSNRHVSVRAAALRGLAAIGQPTDLPLVLDAYAAAAADVEPDAALAALEALGVLAQKGLPVARSFYRRFEPPANPRVRRRAAELLSQDGWGAPDPAESVRSLDFYRRVVEDYVRPELEGLARPLAVFETEAGSFEVELLGADAPLTVHNFVSLAERGYYDGGRWHRVVPYFVLQDGDPRGDGLGGPGYTIRDEINRYRYDRGTLGMALSGPDTGGSQFFIAHAPQPHLDGGYTVFGSVVTGIDVADRVVQDDGIRSIRIVRSAPPEGM